MSTLYTVYIIFIHDNKPLNSLPHNLWNHKLMFLNFSFYADE